MTDLELKNLDKKSLRLMIKDLTAQRDTLLNQIGGLNSQTEKLESDKRIMAEQLAVCEKNRLHVESKVSILEESNHNLQAELQLQTANKSIALILQEFGDRVKNHFKKKGH